MASRDADRLGEKMVSRIASRDSFKEFMK